MKHAYCIIAHHNWWQLKVLLRLLDDERNDIFIHIDKKAVGYDKKSIEEVCIKSSVRVYQNFFVSWGSYSLVECELLLFQHAFEESVKNDESYAYYHLLSGDDLPLKSQDEIHEFFRKHDGYNFIRFDDDFAKSTKCIERVQYYSFMNTFQIQLFNRAVEIVDRQMKRLQRKLHVNRMNRFPYDLQYGSQWVSLRKDAIIILLNNKQLIKQLFRLTCCSDELYKHTILRKAEIPLFSMDKNYVKSCLRYIDFSTCQAHPKILTMNDFNTVMNSGALFARKFDETIDRDIIRMLYMSISPNNHYDICELR